jgi:hypothetical protein
LCGQRSLAALLDLAKIFARSIYLLEKPAKKDKEREKDKEYVKEKEW